MKVHISRENIEHKYIQKYFVKKWIKCPILLGHWSYRRFKVPYMYSKNIEMY